ncbi:transketolase [Virgibacillus proomii]|uniref:transketolase n=1 Tax=Virgibacillus proomii TaxID=84407 RepID=UPI000984D648|nr:transketolase [Virgibacillus proomii]
MFDNIDHLAVNTIRALSIDAINAANSGHPGLPMGAAPMAYVLWTKHLKVNPKNPKWANRDRFVLSAGHGSAMLYSLLHLAEYDVTIDDLKNFRQLGSRTPGHPEFGVTDGVEATTGPLGQGIANAVGMAMTEAHLAASYNQDSFPIIDHYTYALCGDGDLMEGVAAEAASLAGHLKLGKLIVLYDSNDISLDGPTSKAFTEDVGARFIAYGWQHIVVADGNDLESISKAIETAKAEIERPTLIEVKTIIGYGAPHQGTNKVHGSPLGEENTMIAKEKYSWAFPPFTVPKEVALCFHEHLVKPGEKREQQWNSLLATYEQQFPKKGKQLIDALNGNLPANWEDLLPRYSTTDTPIATRKASEAAIQAISKKLASFWGGSADLSSSNNTMIHQSKDFSPLDYSGRNIWFGVREFAMGAIMNGMLLHGGTIPYVGTFFVFSDYLRAAIRVAAISHLPGIYVLTHDSISVGEDGPTHEPIEQLASFRSMPNISVIRPADGNEASQAWRMAIRSTSKPTLLILSRQNLPILPGTREKARLGVEKGAYILSPARSTTQHGIIIASGSEVNLAIQVQKKLSENEIDVSVVSMPSFDLFDQQDKTYQAHVLPNHIRNRVSIELGSNFGWSKYTGLDGINISVDKFGASGKGEEVVKAYNFTTKHIVRKYLEVFCNE